MLRLFTRSSTAGFAAVILSGAALLSYGVGLVRDRVMAVYFGQSSMVDAYHTAFLLPDFIFNLFIAGALSGVFIPIFSEYLIKDEEEAYRVCNTFLTIMNGLVIVVSGISFLLLPWMVPWMFAEASAEVQHLIVDLTRIMLLSPIVMGLSNTLGSMLISLKHYMSYSLSAPLYNVGIILGMVFWHESQGIYSAAYGVLIGLVLHMGVRFFDLWKVGYRYEPRLDWKHPGFQSILKLMIPKAIGMVAWQGNMWLYNIIGYGLVGGSIAAFNYARNIQSFSVSLFGIALATAVFPFLAEMASRKEHHAFSAQLEKTTSQVLYLTIPAMVGIMVLSRHIVGVILGGGAFDATAMMVTAGVLWWFAFSIPLEGVMHVFSRAFYSYKNTMIPVGITLIFLVLNIGWTLLLTPFLGVEAFPIAFVLSSVVQTLLLMIVFYRQFHGFRWGYLLKNTAVFAGASGVMALVVLGNLWLLNGGIHMYSLVSSVVLGGAAYVGMTYWWRCPEVVVIQQILGKLWLRAGRKK